MGILDRFATIVKANINELLDHAEDPAKMVDQYLNDLTESLAEVKREAANVIAEEKRCRRMVAGYRQGDGVNRVNSKRIQIIVVALVDIEFYICVIKGGSVENLELYRQEGSCICKILAGVVKIKHSPRI